MRRRVLFTANTADLAAGTSRSLHALTRELQRDFDLAVAFEESEGTFIDALRADGVRVHTLHPRTAVYVPALAALLVTRRIELVYANNFSGRSRTIAHTARCVRRPLVWHIRESLTESSPTRSLRLARVLIANSRDTAARIREFGPRPAPPIVTVPNGVACDESSVDRSESRRRVRASLNLAPETSLILGVGRVSDLKNQRDTLSAAVGFLRERRDTHLAIVGPCPDAIYLRQLREDAAAAGVSGQVHFPGLQDPIDPWFHAADLLVHTSRKESQGRVILEALASRVPVVAYAVGGIPEVLHQVSDQCLVPFGDTMELGNRIRALLGDSDLLHRLGDRGHSVVQEHYSATATTRAVREILHQVLGGNAPDGDSISLPDEACVPTDPRHPR